jgi:hypothetical protein
VCASDVPLEFGDHGELRFEHLRNLRSGAPIGASQVTAVVRRIERFAAEAAARCYRVALRASLVWPYLIRLADPSPVTPRSRGASTPALQLPL